MIKILLGVFADEINAQNINGLNIARNLNKDKFEAHMFYSGATEPTIEGIVFHKISKKTYLRNIQRLFFYLNNRFDIYYFPRLGKAEYVFGSIYGNNRCIITSIELETMLDDKAKMRFMCRKARSVVTINSLLQKNAQRRYGLKTQILYLGCDKTNYIHEKHNHLSRVAFIGTVTYRKRPDLVLMLAKDFPSVVFEFIGDGPMRKELEEHSKLEGMNNVLFTGRIANEMVYEHLKKCDLLLITSENEGQPKTSLEAGSIGVPTCYIRTNYEIDHVKNNETGFVVNSVDEMRDVLSSLADDFSKYNTISTNVKNECKKYLWENLITDYEFYFETQHRQTKRKSN